MPMTARDRAHTHLENARVQFQSSGNKTGDRVDLYAASILAGLEEAVDTRNLCLLQLLAKKSRHLREASRRMHEARTQAGQN